MIRLDPDKFLCSVRAEKPCLERLSYITKVFGVFFTYIQNSQEASTEDTEMHAEIISC